MPFDPGDMRKLMDELEGMVYESMLQTVYYNYSVDDILELSKEQVDEVAVYAESGEGEVFVEAVLMRMIEEWYEEHGR